jgi:hypothetical protein
MTSNLAESMNSVFKGILNEPITTLVQSIFISALNSFKEEALNQQLCYNLVRNIQKLARNELQMQCLWQTHIESVLLIGNNKLSRSKKL